MNDEEDENGPYEDKQVIGLSDIENEMLDSRLLMVNTRNAIPRRLTNDTAGSVIMWQHQHTSSGARNGGSFGQKPQMKQSVIPQPIHLFEEGDFSGVTSRKARSSIQFSADDGWQNLTLQKDGVLLDGVEEVDNESLFSPPRYHQRPK